MTEHVFSVLSRALLRLGSVVLMTLMLGGPLSNFAAPTRQRQPRTKEQILSRIRRAHILSNVPENAFNSFLLSGCMRIDQKLVPKTKIKSDVNCISEETGVLQPSLTYVSVTVGRTRITELADIKQGKGWQIIDPLTLGSGKPSRTVSALPKLKYDALVENAQHSLVTLLGLLQTSDHLSGIPLQTSVDAQGIVLRWESEPYVNEFVFNGKTFLCEKQVRTVGTERSVIKYSNYRTVAGVMLPHTMVVEKGDGTTMATREVRKWELAVQWPDDHFHPETIRAFR